MSLRSGRRLSMPAAVLLLGMALALVGNMATNTVEPPETWWWWPWAVWMAVGLLVVASLRVQYARMPTGGSDAGVVGDLAARLERNWAEEAVRRDVTRPVPLRVSWSSTSRPAASRGTVIGDQPGDWQQFPLRGQADALNEQVVAAFRALPQRQLMVLGEPGAGKSVFAMLLTLGLIRTRAEGEPVPVPVLLAINAWTPDEPVDVFVARRLTDDYADVLAGYGDPQAVAERLVEHRQVMPVLDGLDELPAQAIDSALQALDSYAAAGRSLVVTCRAREYEEAAIRSETILTTAAVVELEPVTVEAAIAYLSYPEPAHPRWEPVFTHLRSRSDGDGSDMMTPADPLARALSTPLMVALARTAYQNPGTDPAELLGLATRQAITDRLMDAFVTAAYGHPSGWRNGQVGSRQRRDDPDRTRRWLTCLAYHLYQSGTRDLHWWQIDPGLLAARPRQTSTETRRMAVVAGGLVAGLVGAAVGASGLWSAVTGVLIMTTAASGWLRPLWPHGYPPYTRLKSQTLRRRRAQMVALPLVYGIGGGLLTGIITTSWTAVLPAGLICGLLTAVLPSWRPAPSTRQAATAAADLANNRRNIAAAAVPQALTSGTVFTLAGELAHTSPSSAIGITAALVYGTTAGLVAGGWTWTLFRLTHARLALYGWLPWRLQHFLAGAHYRGVLRQAGPVYQFRHAIFQDHLARISRARHLRLRVSAGDQGAAEPLASLLVRQDRVDEAIAILQASADAGNREAAVSLADLLAGRGDVDEAIAILQAGADAGLWGADWRLADLLAKQRRVDELRARANAGDRQAALSLANLLAGRGDVDEAIAILQARADAGDQFVAGLLARRSVDELRARADAGDWDAIWLLALMFVRPGRVDEAIAILQPIADARLPSAGRQLADPLAKQGRADELRARANAGDRQAALSLAVILAQQGRVDEAIAILQASADAGDLAASKVLASLLARQGRVDEAIAIQARADAGDGYSDLLLAVMSTGKERVDEAIAILRAWADTGKWGQPGG
ncbi:tetratricopeptide repeat protein [Solwaraspora sp. WMMA2065]|uniref:tetratricopeptide repeat protein n=1 Tax=Solwaraspora sp. WMMA2065 TaxID=3015166 RepID=UPI00259BDD40|nr:tetratricopeptide repeat protein [Solwaraspora sp. WMMA2065]WJK33049.1 NACHT domain-containing protein [Solwaraspora sp. WMMA2065]